MTGGHREADGPRRGVDDRLTEARRRLRADGAADRGPEPVPRGPSLVALQRSAGNAAVSALLAGRWRSRDGEARAKIDAALTEIRRSEPDVAKVEPGLRAAKALGVPVDLNGYAQKPPASALNVVTTGFGPGAVPAKKPVPPTKPTPKKSPLAKSSGPARKPAGGAAGKAPLPPIPTAAAPPTAAGPVDVLAPPVAPTPVRPEDDPGFTQVTGAVRGYARDRRAHPPAAAKAKEAQDAAVAPSGDVDGQAKAAKVVTMDAQPVGGFDKKAFIAAVKTAIEAKSPKNLKEAAAYSESGRAGEAKAEVKGLVGGNKQASAEPVETATAAPPDASKAVPKQVVEMPPEQPGQARTIPAGTAVPKTAPAEQTNLEAGRHEADATMAEAGVTETQLAESGEPEFEGAVAAKKDAAQHADTAPAAFRAQEQAAIGQARGDANQASAATTAGMHGSKLAALAKVVAGKAATKGKDEARRAEVTTKVQGIFAATETAVKKILDAIDPAVDKEFEAGEKRARAAFEQYVAAKMKAYKKDRYGGWLGGLRWAKDKLFGMPAKVNEFFVAGRERYLKEMDRVISRVADVVATNLTAAKHRIAAGKAEIATYVTSLPKDLRKVGANASKEIGDQFGQLESDVNSKQDSLVDSLASKYVDARKGIDDRIEALQAENKGLVDKAIGAIKAVIETIKKLAAMLRDVFVRAAGVVGKIIKAPGKFLDNLIAGVKGGIMRFKDNILTHLKKGLMGWLMGSLAEGGVELPDTFDLRGIVKLLTSIFGLTWANIRGRLVKAVGARAVSVMESSVEIFTLLAKEGPAGLWHLIVEKVGDLKNLIIEKAQDFVVEKIITAGIMWVVGLLNPAAAFIKACKLIYDVVMFFVENASRIAAFVNTILDSVGDIARGAVGGVVAKIEDVLGRMVPILIGFLASLLGVGGIGKKIREIVGALQKPVTKAIDGIIATGLKLAGPLIRGVKGITTKAKAKIEQGKAYVKGKVSAAAASSVNLRDRILGITFRRQFEVDGEQHSMYTKKGKPGLLFTASTNPAPAVQKAPTPEVLALDQQFRTMMGQYSEAAGRLRGTPNDQALLARAERLRTDAEAVLDQLVTLTRQHMASGAMDADSPGMSAPGVGKVGRHGAKPGSLREQRQIWWLESEHVLPFASGRILWDALSQYRPERGWPEDDQQTTIMIYWRAARIKTPQDNVVSGALETELRGLRIPGRIQAGIGAAGAGARSGRAAVRDALASVFAALERARRDAVDRTNSAIVQENGETENGHSRTNAERRGMPPGREPPTPAPDAVRHASQIQYDDIIRLVTEEVWHHHDVRAKAERIQDRPPGGTS